MDVFNRCRLHVIVFLIFFMMRLSQNERPFSIEAIYDASLHISSTVCIFCVFVWIIDTVDKRT